MTDTNLAPGACPAPRRSRAALLRKWLLIALVCALVLVPLLVWVSQPAAPGMAAPAQGAA
ncbi:hypothetical protein [Kerstersia sp.]|uniref:hypothetical protein n=1 Tax=Kerstersia sp. TaxID=1930783 RepID=UPI003F8EBE89